MNADIDREESRFKVLENGDAQVPPDSIRGAGRPLLLLAAVASVAIGAWAAYSLLNFAIG